MNKITASIIVGVVIIGAGSAIYYMNSNASDASLFDSNSNLGTDNDGYASTTDQTAVDATSSTSTLKVLSNKKMTNENAQVAQNGDHVFVNYVGTLTDGKKFDSSYDNGAPIDFILGTGRVIKGWDQGILGMKVGEKKHLVIPPELGYGPQAIPDRNGGVLIPANSTLVFDVELVSIQKAQ